MLYKIIINEENQNLRIDVALSNLSPFSRSMIQKMIYAQKISLNNTILTKANQKTILNEEYILEEMETNISTIKPQEGNLNILFEDDEIIVINKEANIVVHPGANNFENTLINYLSNHCQLSNFREADKLGVVHRLDKQVSGCIIFAKTNEAHANLNEQFEKKTIQKIYHAICYNKITENNVECQNYIARSKTNRQKMACYTENVGKFAHSKFKILNVKLKKELNSFLSYVECMPITGRTHQLRVHLSSLNLPIVGDTVYGNKNLIKLNRILLHAHKIEFIHPKTKETISITCPVPEIFQEIF